MAIGISILTFWTKGYSFIDNQSKEYYLMQSRMLADNFALTQANTEEDYKEFVKTYSDKYKVRITLINQDGDVVADSSEDIKIENHATREEVVKALKGEDSSIVRYSKTMGKEYYYSAIGISSGSFTGIIRVSLPLSQLKELDDKLISSIDISIILCLVVAIILAFYFTKVLSKPIDEVTKAAEEISNGNYSIKIYTREKGQIARLAYAFNKMALTLKSNVSKLTRKNIELEAMLSSMSNGVVAIDNTDAILFNNKAFSKMIDSKSKDLNGKSLYNVVRNSIIFDSIQEVRANKEKVIKEGYLTLNENRIIRVIATHLSKESGKSFGILIIIEDITQIRKLESMRSDFVSNVTHELKTPLTSIRGFVETLKNGAMKDPIVLEKFIDIIDIEVERLYSLIQDILLLSEIESKTENKPMPSDIGKCIEEVIELLRPNVDEKIQITSEVQLNLPPFYCNIHRIKQLLINILDNSIKYTQEGIISIECREDNHYLVIIIKDTGIGIEDKYIERIFERFYRVDKGRSRKQGGTGLGLSIVKHIVELYAGSINIDSKIGSGTKFEIRLPYRKD